MTQRAVIRSLPQAFEVIKQMNLSEEWDLDYRSAARDALVRILEDRIGRYLDETGRLLSDRRNGCFSRHLYKIYVS